jgi:hypothetical protein
MRLVVCLFAIPGPLIVENVGSNPTAGVPVKEHQGGVDGLGDGGA